MKRRKFNRKSGLVFTAVVSGFTGCSNITDEPKATPSSTPKPVPTIDGSNFEQFSDVRTTEQKVHTFTNEFRVTNEKTPWGYDSGLAGIARVHSRDMAKRNYFSHVNPEGQTADDRAQEYGYYANPMGENLAKSDIRNENENPDGLARTFIEIWKTSSSHRNGMLSERYVEEGVGVFIDVDGVAYATTIQSGMDTEVE